MKKFLSLLLSRLPMSLMIPCALLPVPLILISKYAPYLLPLAWLWPATYALTDMLCSAVRGKWRLLSGLAQLVIFAVMAILMFPQVEDTRPYLIPIMYGIVALAELPRNKDHRALQVRLISYSIAGIAVHIIAQILLYTSSVSGESVLEPAKPWLLISFFLFIFSGALQLNRANLSLISQGRLFAGAVMKRKNILLTLLFLGIALAAACLPGVVTAVSKAFQWLFVAILFLLDLLGRVGTGSPDGTMPSDETGESIFGAEGSESIQAEWLEVLVAVVSLAAIAAGLIFGAVVLWRKLKTLVQYMRKRLYSYLNAVTEDYVDEITDTRDDPDRIQRSGPKMRALSPLEISRLSPSQRIRYRYRQLMRKNPQWQKSSTPRENLPDTAASVYEAVRYGEQTANEADAKKFAEETKKK